jgi:2-dehydro-3-deoxygluconokinase
MKYATLGEIMLRLSTPGAERIVQAKQFDINYGGGEANVAVSLANYGCEAAFITKLPANLLGDAALDSLREYGVEVSKIVRGGDRLGIYYLESGVSMRPSKVIYDRAHSAIAEATVGDFDFEKLLKDVQWLHISGITPALSKSCAEITLNALKAARKLGVTTSFDLNYRAKLWTKEEAQACLKPMMKYVDYVIGNEEDAQSCLGFAMSGDVTSGKLDLEGYKRMLKELCELYHFKGAATSLRESHSASDNGWSCALSVNGEFHHSKHYDVRVVDRVGAGDSFSAGLIYGLTHYKDAQTAIEFAAAASALKHTIPGDFNHVDVKEVETLMGGDASGRVQR